VLAAGGAVTPAARGAFEAGLTDPESRPRSRYYLALAQLQQGDAKGALDAWRALAAEAPADAEWLPMVRQRIAQAANALGLDPATADSQAGRSGDVPARPAGGPPSEAAVAAVARATADATPEQRQAMIRGMVEKLAARLEQQPDDVDGWTRLGRSYLVLHQPDKARDAYARALQLRPGDAALQQAYAEAAAQAQAGAAR
jgi:cytochrome c-type biogenesis protein CcmH